MYYMKYFHIRLNSNEFILGNIKVVIMRFMRNILKISNFSTSLKELQKRYGLYRDIVVYYCMLIKNCYSCLYLFKISSLRKTLVLLLD